MSTQANPKTSYFPPFCEHCGDKLPELQPTAIACPSCGGDLIPNHMKTTDTSTSTHDARTAGLLSLFLPGAGQVYNGQFFRGLLIFGTCWLVIPWVFGVIDAYSTARRAELTSPQFS